MEKIKNIGIKRDGKRTITVGIQTGNTRLIQNDEGRSIGREREINFVWYMDSAVLRHSKDPCDRLGLNCDAQMRTNCGASVNICATTLQIRTFNHSVRRTMQQLQYIHFSL